MFENKESAQKAVDDSGEANFLGSRLTINYKTGKTKLVHPKIDKDCWFCFDNSIDRHLIFHESANFYCALPKGPVSNEHFLIIPKQHIGN